MSEFTYTDPYDSGRMSARVYVHPSRETAIEAEVVHPQPSGAPYVALALDGEAADLTVFINDPAVLDRLISTLAEARAAWVADLIAFTDIPKAG